eukprot:14972678-Alexandrium_andersonii.AAC.1
MRGPVLCAALAVKRCAPRHSECAILALACSVLTPFQAQELIVRCGACAEPQRKGEEREGRRGAFHRSCSTGTS